MQRLKCEKIIYGLPPELESGQSIALDLELSGLNENQLHRPAGRFLSLAGSFDGKTTYIIFDDSQIQEFLNRISKAVWVFHNSTFDIGHLRRWATVEDRYIRDTMLIEKILWADYYDTFGLNDLVRRYLKCYMDKDVRKDFHDLSGTMTPKQIEYAALDVIGTWLVDQEQQKLMDEKDKQIWDKIDMPTVWISVGLSGFAVDKEMWANIATTHSKIKAELEEELGQKYGKNQKKMVGRGKARTEIEEFVPFNPASPAQVLSILRGYGANVDSTGDEVLSNIVGTLSPEGEEFVSKILKYRESAKKSSTYGVEYLQFVEEDGRIYSSLNVLGAACLPAGELVLTSSGYLPTEKVKVGHKVISHNGVPQNVVASFPNGESPILRVTISNGLSLRCSHNHPFLTFSSGEFRWKEAKDLEVSDLVMVQSHLNGVEQWKKVKDWSNFSVSTWGRVRNDTTGNILSQQPKDRWGHLKVTLTRNGSQVRGEDRKDLTIHRLVAQAFLGEARGMEVCHYNGIAWDNSVGNLHYGTSKDNTLESLHHGTMLKRNIGNTIIKQSDVDFIRSQPRTLGSDGRIAKLLGISREHVRDIRNGKRWKVYPEQKREVQLHLEKVTSVEEDGYETVYGLTVENDHSHITGGIVTHNTGRMSSRSPNLQQVPRSEEYRKCFIAGRGRKLVIADYSSQEPRVFAYLTQDETLIEIFNSGKDIYCEVARFAFGENITKADKERRNQVKSLVLGLMYGMSPYGFAIQNEVEPEVAQADFDRFFEAFPKAAEWVRARQSVNSGHTVTVLGRKCHLHPYDSQWKRNALNNPIQGTGADMVKIAMRNFKRENLEMFKEDLVGIILPVHDEIILWADESVAEDVKNKLETCMISVAERIHRGIPASVEAHVCESWAQK